ncbi:probable receptor-like protein kinase At2g42960 [Cynara cardunculus var. scolymus]|uniref:probable receptor-like protein kinase At2g42960 n=1 Tax=Cynara cardunculus var. scolymus TaxID=59895 RepID=UPI000D62CDBB|nr:probable receptor-like protein kinase At2g42960 [Cynara cardunculus var. scolymus]
MSSGNLDAELSKKTSIVGLKLWVVICLSVGVFICMFLCLLSMWVTCQRKSRRRLDKYPLSQIPNVPKDIRVDRVGGPHFHSHSNREHPSTTTNDEPSGKNSGKMLFQLAVSKSGDADNVSQSSSMYEKGGRSQSGEEGTSGTVWKQSSQSHGPGMASPFIGLPEASHLGWGHWFTLRDLELATRRFSKENVVGEGGYGIVYKGTLINGTVVAVKKLLNNLGQAEKEFRGEVDAIGHVRHKNLVRLLGYCIEGTHRMLVYEYVDKGNLEQWLHGQEYGVLTWEARMKVLLGIAKALAYLHEAIEPKVVHRDIKSSNILIDREFNGKLSDFGLAKLLDSGESHVNTRVMGTFGYVAPEYANTGMLNEKSDIYSFGVLLLEAVTGRDPVDHNRCANEVNLVEWLKMMVGNRRAEEVVDPNLQPKPSTHALKRALLVALRCVDPESERRPKMSQVVRMLDADFPYREERRNRKSRTASMDSESMGGSADIERPPEI